MHSVSNDHSAAILAIETTGKSGSVALSWRNEVHGRDLSTEVGSAQSLAPTIEKLFRETNCSPNNLCGIAVAEGPGSFTGLRVGITTAKVMGYALGISVLGIDSLECMVEAYRHRCAHLVDRPHSIWSMMEAYRGEWFGSCWSIDAQGNTECVCNSRVDTVDFWIESITAASHASQSCLLGSVVTKAWPRLEGIPGCRMESTIEPKAIDVLRLAQRRMKSDWIDPMALQPKYLRRSAAEEKATARAD